MTNFDNSLLVKISNASKTYESGSTHLSVLRNIGLDIYKGDSLAITGPSGSGKSTLLNLIGGLEPLSSGSIQYQGRDIPEMTQHELAIYRNQELGFVFQLHHLLPQCTALENVLVPVLANQPSASKEQKGQAMNLLGEAGLTERKDHYPSQLSGGERQRVALVRALINQPKLVLADEPTGSLDQRHADEITELMIKLNQDLGVTLLVVTHSQRLANKMSGQLNISDGQLTPA